jgi:2-methylisocitrate lyase-like PEP mutase family enzyme
LLAATVANIARAVRVPVTADIEGGYSKDVNAVGNTVAAVIDAGAVGINIEDGDDPPDLLCGKIE